MANRFCGEIAYFITQFADQIDGRQYFYFTFFRFILYVLPFLRLSIRKKHAPWMDQILNIFTFMGFNLIFRKLGILEIEHILQKSNS